MEFNKLENTLATLINLHEYEKCSCEGFQEGYDTKMCSGYAYLSGNISAEEAVEGMMEDE